MNYRKNLLIHEGVDATDLSSDDLDKWIAFLQIDAKEMCQCGHDLSCHWPVGKTAKCNKCDCEINPLEDQNGLHPPAHVS